MNKKQTEEAETSRFHNRLYRAEISRTPAGSPILKLVPNNPSGPFGRPRRIGALRQPLDSSDQGTIDRCSAGWDLRTVE